MILHISIIWHYVCYMRKMTKDTIKEFVQYKSQNSRSGFKVYTLFRLYYLLCLRNIKAHVNVSWHSVCRNSEFSPHVYLKIKLPSF